MICYSAVTVRMHQLCLGISINAREQEKPTGEDCEISSINLVKCPGSLGQLIPGQRDGHTLVAFIH